MSNGKAWGIGRIARLTDSGNPLVSWSAGARRRRVAAPRPAVARGNHGAPDTSSIGGSRGARVMPHPETRQSVCFDPHDRRSDVLVPSSGVVDWRAPDGRTRAS